jgi:hypothetical protein
MWMKSSLSNWKLEPTPKKVDGSEINFHRNLFYDSDIDRILEPARWSNAI